MKSILRNKSRFGNWVKKHVKLNNLKENDDFFIEKHNINSVSEKYNYYFTDETCKKIISSQSRNKIATRIIELIEQGFSINECIDKIENEIEIIKFEDEEYPEQLKNIKNPPKQLYVKGNLENLKEPGIAVIGSRHCSNYGRQICKIFTNNLVGYNLNIISGLAVGIDTCAHKACLEAKGKTIAVLPSGFNKIFPKVNEQLVFQILEKGGTVITEYSPDFEKTSESCKQRNRIMSGLAIGTLVIEAEKRSGTSITVNYAKEQNKKAFCIPSSLMNSKGIGTNEMIKENRAQIVTEVEDIIKEYPELKLKKNTNFNFLKVEKNSSAKKEKKSKVVAQIEIEEENQEIYKILTKEPKHINEIAEELNQPISEITYKLTMLELQGAIEELPGKKFKKKSN